MLPSSATRSERKGTPTATRVRSLELVFYRGNATAAMLQDFLGDTAEGAQWIGFYLEGDIKNMLSTSKQFLESLTPPYASISFVLPTNDATEHKEALAALNEAGIPCEEVSLEKQPLDSRVSRYRLSGSTFNPEIFRLVFEGAYGTPTLLSQRFIFTISPAGSEAEGGLSLQGIHSRFFRSCLASTYYWHGLQLVGWELQEEAVEKLAESLASQNNLAFAVRNR